MTWKSFREDEYGGGEMRKDFFGDNHAFGATPQYCVFDAQGKLRHVFYLTHSVPEMIEQVGKLLAEMGNNVDVNELTERIIDDAKEDAKKVKEAEEAAKKAKEEAEKAKEDTKKDK